MSGVIWINPEYVKLFFVDNMYVYFLIVAMYCKYLLWCVYVLLLIYLSRNCFPLNDFIKLKIVLNIYFYVCDLRIKRI